MNRLTFCGVALLLLGAAVGGSRTFASNPAVATPEFRKADQVWPRNVNTRIAAFTDLDGDGDLDGVFASMWSPSLVLLNDGRGRFAASAQTLPDEMHDIAIGDVDGDGDKDLFFAPIGRGGGAPLFLNDGRGRFVQAPVVFEDREEVVSLVDLDNDGDLDAYLFSGKAYANDGRGRFERRESLGFSPVGFCDLNGDRVVDAVSETHVYLNNGRGRFTQSSAIPHGGPDRPGSLAFADVDGDRDSDVIVLHTGQPSLVLLNDGAGVLRDSGQRLPPRVIEGWGFVAAGDLTGDGAADIVITHRQNPAQVWVNDGKGTFTDSGVRLGDGEDNDWTASVLMDFDRDGDVDVFITNRSSGKHGLWFNQLIERRGANTIFDAVQANDLASVKRLVETDAARAQLRDKDENTPLHLAAARGCVPIAEYLLEKGAVIEAPNSLGNTPLHAAAIAGAVGTIDLLLQRGARIDAANAQQNSPLQEAIFNGKDEAARLLVERGADVRHRDNLGRTPLHYAARYNRKAIVELLIAKGADLSSRAAVERTPLNLLTLMTRHVDVARILIRNGADVNAADAQGTMPLEHAVHQGSRPMIDLLLDSGAGFRTAPDSALVTLRLAAAAGSARLFTAVAETVGDVLFRDGLENAATMNTAISGGSVEIVKGLLARKVPIDPSADVTGATPLHRAVSASATGLIELLVSHGVDIDRRTNNGRSAYNIAEALKNQDAMSLLAKLGATTGPQRFPVLTGPYLGQPLPGQEAARFAPGIVFYNHSSLTVSPDGQEMYWGSASAIMTTRLQNGRWTLPEAASFSGESTTPMPDDVPFVAPDNKRLFFTSRRPIGAEAPGKENIWYVERTATGWSAPKPVGAAVNALTLHWQVSVSRTGTLYFAAQGDEGRGIYASHPVNGEYGKPFRLPAAINATGRETCPYIAPDESYLTFARIAPDGRNVPLFVSFKSKDETWGEPVALNVPNIGPTAIVSPDGKYLFLGGITWMSAGIIEELRPKER